MASLTPATTLTNNGGMVASPDGTAVCVGSTGTAIELARFLPDGGVDMGFGDAGVASAPSALAAVGMARMIDGGFAIAVQSSGSSVGVARFLPDGGLDTSFGDSATPGFHVIPTDGSYAMAIAVDAAGRIVIAVGAVGANQNNLLFARFLP